MVQHTIMADTTLSIHRINQVNSMDLMVLILSIHKPMLSNLNLSKDTPCSLTHSNLTIIRLILNNLILIKATLNRIFRSTMIRALPTFRDSSDIIKEKVTAINKDLILANLRQATLPTNHH